jgi:hypothetical protein
MLMGASMYRSHYCIAAAAILDYMHVCSYSGGGAPWPWPCAHTQERELLHGCVAHGAPGRHSTAFPLPVLARSELCHRQEQVTLRRGQGVTVQLHETLRPSQHLVAHHRSHAEERHHL